jgi:microcystin-dependent protein
VSDYFVGEIRMFAFDWPPVGWALCNGAQLGQQQNAALYSLLGYQFGGSGPNFNLPDLRGRTPAHAPSGIAQGQKVGSEAVALTIASMPAHSHSFVGSTSPATVITGTSNVLAVTQPPSGQTVSPPLYGTAASDTTLIATTIGNAGSGAPHPNMQPFVVVNYCISLSGLYPSRP